MINTYDKNWDNNIIDYDVADFNWYEFWLTKAKEKFPSINSLETIHKDISIQDVNELIHHLQKITLTKEFVDKIDEYFNDILDFVDYEYMTQKVFNIRIVIPDQQKAGRLLNFHKDSWVGNGMGIKNVWTPITDSFDSNSIHVIGSEESNRISSLCETERWDYDKIQNYCREIADPVTIKKGQAFLFASNNIHGNVNNDTDITRVSMDGRILPEGGFYYRKLPGGYFRFKGEVEANIQPDKSRTWISYAGWNSNYTKDIPVHMQRYQINEYCKDKDIRINDYQYENEFMDWVPNFSKYINDFNVNGIVCFSLYGLPDDPFKRQTLLLNALEKDIHLIFVNENIYFKTKKDLEYIKKLYKYFEHNESPKVTMGHI